VGSNCAGSAGNSVELITFCVNDVDGICCIFRLMKRGLDVNHRHQLGWTALQVAVVNKNVQ